MKQKGVPDFIVTEDPIGPVPRSVRITKSQLVDLLIKEGLLIPSNATVTFKVPSGGDYSGVAVEMDNKEQIITVRYER